MLTNRQLNDSFDKKTDRQTIENNEKCVLKNVQLRNKILMDKLIDKKKKNSQLHDE